MTTPPASSPASSPASTTAATHDATTHAPGGELRLRLRDSGTSTRLDGAWWPRSRDLAAEGADLVDRFPEHVGRVARLLFSRPDWDAVAGEPSTRRIRTARGQTKVGSFPSDDTHLMIAQLLSGRRLKLLVVPSDTAEDVAERILEQVGTGQHGTAHQLLGLAGADQGDIGSDVWDDHHAGF